MTVPRENSNRAHVAIIGGSLVGCLSAIYFAERGWQVDIYELRQDLRQPEAKAKEEGRSLNLAISDRGLGAIHHISPDLERHILAETVPMQGRMIHVGQQQHSQRYSIHGYHINSLSRLRLNQLLLDEVERHPRINIHFEHRLIATDFDRPGRTGLVFDGKKDGSADTRRIEKEADLVVGADGAYSRIRTNMMRKQRMDYEQQYIDCGFTELTMPASSDGTFHIDPHHLHIWPRKSFLLIALPNPDKSFTCSLFMPFSLFESINTKDKLLAFFREHFEDALPLLGEEHLVHQYFKHPRGSFASIKTSLHHYKDRVVILGDAAHAMVPFYGQGMNCGFEDVQVLDEVFRQYGVKPQIDGDGKIEHLFEALQAYSNRRVADAHAMCDLAIHNYDEMRAGVTTLSFLIQRRIEFCLHYLFPRWVIPLYTMVTFSSLPYSHAIKRWRKQSFWIRTLTGLTVMGAAASGLFHAHRHKDAIAAISRAWLRRLN